MLINAATYNSTTRDIELRRGLPFEVKCLIAMPNPWYCTICSLRFGLQEHRLACHSSAATPWIDSVEKATTCPGVA